MIDTAEFRRKRTERVMAPWAIELPQQSTLLLTASSEEGITGHKSGYEEKEDSEATSK
jgi:hypothetical protein